MNKPVHMNKGTILEQLRKATSNNRLKFPEALDIQSNDGILVITMKPKGLEGNMQTNPSAFEGWAIAIKSICPEIAKKVIIRWSGENVERDNPHYYRFLYRVIRFSNSYKWASYEAIDEKAKADVAKVLSEDGQLVANFPDKDAQENAEKEEAKLERKLNDILPGKHDHQLPMGLFFQEKNKKNGRTPRNGSQIDLWSFDNGIFSVYELKKDDNKMVGIISELMFYVNVIKDLTEGIIKYPKEAKQINFRSFNIIYSALSSDEIREVCGVFLTNDLHVLIKSGGTNLFNLLNDNTRNIRYKQIGFIITKLEEIIP